MNKDFETLRESDEFDADRPDPEEPSTRQHAEQRSHTEIDDLDWADQHPIVEDPMLEENAAESDVDMH